MSKCVVFSEGVPKSFEGDYCSNPSVMWINYEKSDAELHSDLKKMLSVDDYIIDDLLEEQRSNIINFEEFSVVVLSFPKNKSELLQITFIISKKRLVSIVNDRSEMVEEILKRLLKIQGIMGVTNLFSIILDKLVEKSVLVLDKLEDDLEQREKLIFSSKNDKLFLFKNNELRDDLYYFTKIMKSNLEVINDVLDSKISFLNLRYFGEHLEDRFLYLLDSCENLREMINSLNNNYLSMINYDTNNQIYRLTIIGSLLILPSIVSSFFGMNVTLPSLSFYEILGLTAALSVVSYFILKSRF